MLVALGGSQQHAAATADDRQDTVAVKDSLDYVHDRDLLFLYFLQVRLPTLPTMACSKSNGRVGRAKAPAKEPRMTLAVNAQSRHTFAHYDSILSTTVASVWNLNADRVARENAYD